MKKYKASKIVFLAFLINIAAVSPIFAESVTPNNESFHHQSILTSQDQEFLKQAAQANLSEILTGKLALKKTISTETSELSQTVIDDHTKANADLEAIAKKSGIILPKTPDMKQIGVSAELTVLTAETFERQYLKRMVEAHQAAISLFETQITKGTSPELKNYASFYLPQLKMHYQAFEKQANRLTITLPIAE